MQKDRTDPRKKESLYQNIFDNAIDALILYDLETGLVVESNPAACAFYNVELNNGGATKWTTR